LDLPLDHELVGIVRKHHQSVTGKDAPGIGFYDPGSYAGADSGHLFAAGCPCLNYGPTGHDIYENSVDIDMMMTGARVMALTAAEIITRTKA
jgi:acetylornithine deacetylase